jgi:hypothetical protein
MGCLSDRKNEISHSFDTDSGFPNEKITGYCAAFTREIIAIALPAHALKFDYA